MTKKVSDNLTENLKKSLKELHSSLNKKGIPKTMTFQIPMDSEMVNEMVRLYGDGISIKDNAGIENLMSSASNIDNKKETQTVNKNAYEIRADILSLAVDWNRFRVDIANGKVPYTIDDDTVLETARKFYTFVENKS